MDVREAKCYNQLKWNIILIQKVEILKMASKSRLAKCRQISVFAMPVAFTGKYREIWQIMENTGKYDLQPSTFQ